MFLRVYRIWAFALAILISAFVFASSAMAIDATVTKTADGVEGGTNGQFTITLDSAATEETVISFDVAGTANDEVGEDDFTALADNITFAIGDTSQTIDVVLTDDNVTEDDETVILTLTTSSVSGVVIGTPNTATVDITDDDTADISVTTITNMAEPGTNGLVQFDTTNTVDGGITINYSLGGTATSGSDYTTPDGSVTIAEGALSGTEAFSVIDDTDAEGLETVIVTITSVSHSNATINSDNNTDNITISSNDTVNVTVANGANGVEGGTNASFLISLSESASTPIDINYILTGTATSGTDYTAPSGSLTIPAGSASSQLSIPITDDNANDAGETIIITIDSISSGPAVIASPSTATNTIVDNDQVLVSITAGNNGSETAEDNVTFTISLDQAAPSPFQVNFSRSGTATAVDDYDTSPCCLVSFAAGEQTQTIAYTVQDDNIAEGTETLIVTLDNATGPATIGSQNTATRLITDNDTAVITVGTSPAAADEASLTGTQFTVNTSVPASYPITLSYTMSGTATSGSDYTAPSGSVTILADNTSEVVDIAVLNDSNAEDNETIIFNLASVTSGAAVIGSVNSATATLTDNDTVGVSIISTTDTSEDNGSAAGNFRIGLATTAEADITVSFTLDSSADNGTDYTVSSTSATIPAGSNNVDVAITAVDDTLVEGVEEVRMTLTSVDSGPGDISGATPQSLSITDNDNASITISALSDGAEGGNGTFLIASDATATADYTITYSITGSVSGSDYTDTSGGDIDILTGNDNATLSIAIVDDSLIEDNETLTVTLTGVTSGDAVIGGTDNASITITSDDRANVSIANDNNSFEAGPVDGALTISLDNASEVPITVNYSVTGTATSGTDYAALSGSALIAAGDTSHVLTIDVTDDSAYEDNETIIITLDNATGPAVISATDNATNILVSDDNAGLSVAVTTHATEDNDTNGVFTFTLSEDVDQDVIFTYAIDNTSTADDPADYAILDASPVTISSGDTTATVRIDPEADTNIEGDESVIITITGITAGPASISSTDTATMMVGDNDTPTISVTANDNGSETGPDNASFTVNISSAAVGDVVVAYTLTGTAVNGTDYNNLSGSLTIDNATTSEVITIVVSDDSITEDNETVIITLDNVASGTGQISSLNNSASITIEDNDNSSISVSAPSSVNEGQTANFTVTLTAASGTDTTVTYTDNGTATSGTDYTAPSGSLVITAGNTSGTISIPVLTDDVTDDGETLSVTLTAVSGLGSLAATPTASTTINDISDVEKELKEAVIATRKMIREDLATSLDDTRRTTTSLVRGAINRLSDENSHDYTELCEDDGQPNGDIQVEGSDQAIEGYGKYNKTDRKCFTNDVSIASVDVAVTDDGNGAETLHLNTVYASETTSDDLYSKYGYYIELSVRNREQTKDKGEMDTVRVNIGSYLIYRSAAQTYLSSYITFGASSSDYELTHENVKASGNFMAYNMGTGIGFTGETRSRYVKFQPSFNLDLFATGYQSFEGDFKLNGTTYKRQIDQSILHKATLSISPVMNFYSSSNFAEASSVTTVAPSIFCTNGSFETDCGFSLMVENISRNILGSDLTTKLNYEAIGDTTTTALSLNATTHLFGNKFIKLSNKVTAKQDDGSASSASTSSDVDVSYKVFIEMLY